MNLRLLGMTNLRKGATDSIRKFWRETEGAALVEYGLLVLLIAALCIVAIRALGSGINNTMNSAGNAMP
jgi:Flp pilus assembly pilin Flp